jgi:hypothetical protein
MSEQVNQSASGYDSEAVKQDTPVTPPAASGYDSESVKQDTTVQNGVLQTPEEQAMSQDKSIGPEERQFLTNNPKYKYIPADPKFRNRPAGIYPDPSLPENKWRNSPDTSQAPIDLHLLKHTAEGAGYGVMATLPAIGLGAAPELAAGVRALPGVTEAVMGHLEEQATEWATKYPALTKLIMHAAPGIVPTAAGVIGYLIHKAK